MVLQNSLVRTICATLLVLTACHARADDYPNRPVTVFIPFTAGGSTDAWLRPLTQHLSAQWKQPVIIEPKPGAATTVAAAFIAAQKPDGYRLFATGVPAHTISPQLLASVKYDALKDFTPISGAVDSPYIILVSPSSSVSSIESLVARAKEKPGTITWGSTGSGSGSHLTGEVLKQAAGIDTIHVSFRGAAPAITALLGNHIDYLITDISALALIEAGQLRALAVTSLNRFPHLPNTPTLNETVAKGFDATNRNVFLGPPGMPAELTASIGKAIHEALASSEIKTAYAKLGLVPLPLDSRQLGLALQSDYERFGRIIKQIGLKVQ